MIDLASLLRLAQNNLWATAAAVFLATTLVLLLSSALGPQQPPLDLDSMGGGESVGDITPEELSKHDGRDPFRPIYLSIKGTVYDVTPGRSFYGPGGGYAAFAGKECARALAKMSMSGEDISGDLEGCSDKELGVLADWEAKLSAKYKVVGKVWRLLVERRGGKKKRDGGGKKEKKKETHQKKNFKILRTKKQLVQPKFLTLSDLRKHDGSDPSLPMYISIQGTIFDVSTGKAFYGPEGVYPFAGRECACAFALVSTDVADCVSDVTGLGALEMDNLRDWRAKFEYKYPVVGRIVEEEKEK